MLHMEQCRLKWLDSPIPLSNVPHETTADFGRHSKVKRSIERGSDSPPGVVRYRFLDKFSMSEFCSLADAFIIWNHGPVSACSTNMVIEVGGRHRKANLPDFIGS